MEALEVGKADWALQLVQEMLGYRLEHLLVCTSGCAIPIIQAIIIALQLHVCVATVHVEPPLKCGSDFVFLEGRSIGVLSGMHACTFIPCIPVPSIERR